MIDVSLLLWLYLIFVIVVLLIWILLAAFVAKLCNKHKIDTFIKIILICLTLFLGLIGFVISLITISIMKDK